jgi:2,6-dihydroxypseudooxynicotine hydrolase
VSLDAERLVFLDRGRLAADGIPYGDLVGVKEAVVGRGVRWLDAWMSVSKRYEALTANPTATPASRGGWLWLGALTAHAAQLYWLDYPDEKRNAEDRRATLYEQAADYLIPPAMKLELQVGARTVPAFLRRPGGQHSEPGAAAILLGGLDSTKEESRLFEDLLLERGVATLTFDGPGQGLTAREVPLGCRFDPWVSAAVTLLAQVDGVDAGRIGLVGRSLGGTYALQAAASEQRLRASVAWSPLVRGASYDALPEGVRRTFQYACGGRSEDETRELLAGLFDVTADVNELECPTFIVQGKLDQLVPIEDMAALDSATSPLVETFVHDSGNHGCHNVASVVRPLMADWLSARLGVSHPVTNTTGGGR